MLERIFKRLKRTSVREQKLKIQVLNFFFHPFNICPQKSVEAYIKKVKNLWVPRAFIINKYIK